MYSIFMVDDEEIIRNGIRSFLATEDDMFTICGEAADGELALPMIQELKPDILLTDINMPFVNGLELCEVVRKKYPWIHLLVFSGYDEFEYAKQAISLQVDEYILKPLTKTQLMDALRKTAASIEQERIRYLKNTEMHADGEKRQRMAAEQLINGLLDERFEVSEALALAEEEHIPLLSEQYMMCCLEAAGDGTSTPAALRHAVSSLLEQTLKDSDDLLWAPRGDRHALLLKGKKADNLLETAYETAQLLQHESTRFLQTRLCVGIGPQVTRLGELASSYQDARRLLERYMLMPEISIISASDVTPRKKGQVIEKRRSIATELRHLHRADVDELLQNYFLPASNGDSESLLYRYYLLADLVVSVKELTDEIATEEEAAAEVVADIEEIMHRAITLESTIEYARGMIERFLDLRDMSPHFFYGVQINIANAYSREHFADREISLNTVAEKVGFSPTHFSTVFRQQTGMTFIEYLTRTRLEEGKRLLRETDRKLADISYDIGYNEAHYFSYIFKKYEGMMPSVYRKQFQES